jgi:mannosyltransferase
MIAEEQASPSAVRRVASLARGARWEVMLPVTAAALVLITGAIGLGRPSYWFDEAASLSGADRSPSELAALIQTVDAVHAAHYALLSGWIDLFGAGEVATRALSLIALAAACAGFVLFVHRFRGPLIAAAAGLCFAVLPGIAWSGAEARGYAFALAACVWALAALQSALKRGGWRWSVYGLLLLVSLLFSIMTVLMIVAHAVYVRLIGRVGVLRPGFVLAWGASLLAGIPLFLAAMTQRQQLDWIDLDPIRLAGKVAIGQLFLGPRDGAGLSSTLPSAVIAAMIVGALGCVALVAARGPARSSVLFAVTWFAVPTLALAIPVLVGVELYQERYLVFAAPGACLLIAEGLLLLRPRKVLAPVVLVLLVAALIGPLVAQRDEGSKAGDEYRALADVGASADTVVYTVPTARGIGIAYPRALDGAEDVLLLSPPAASASLWGISAASPEPPAEAHGRVAVYSPSDDGESLAAVSEALERWGCVPAERLSAVRFSVEVYDCGAG